MRQMLGRWMVAAAMAAGAAFCLAAEEEPAAVPAPARPVALVKAGPVDDALVQRVQNWVHENLAVEVPVLPPVEWSGDTLDQVGSIVAKSLGQGDIGAVVLAWPDHDIAAHGVTMLGERVFVVNVRAMKTEGADQEAFERRVERLTMRGIGVLSGMDPCPNIMCGLTQYGSMEGLDEIGRNYCPPCARKFQEKMRERGVALDPNSPFYMLELPEAQ
jgi:hypothetical protein